MMLDRARQVSNAWYFPYRDRLHRGPAGLWPGEAPRARPPAWQGAVSIPPRFDGFSPHDGAGAAGAGAPDPGKAAPRRPTSGLHPATPRALGGDSSGDSTDGRKHFATTG